MPNWCDNYISIDANEELQEKIDTLGSVKSAQQIAEEELGLINPDAIILDPAVTENSEQ